MRQVARVRPRSAISAIGLVVAAVMSRSTAAVAAAGSVPVKTEVGQPGVLRAADLVLAAGAAAVPQTPGRRAGRVRVSGERGEPVPVGVGEPQLRTGWGRSARTMTRIPGGQPDRSSTPVASATHIPAAGPWSASYAGVHAAAGIRPMRSAMSSDRGRPSE